jgi:hypothetical protein
MLDHILSLSQAFHHPVNTGQVLNSMAEVVSMVVTSILDHYRVWDGAGLCMLMILIVGYSTIRRGS